MRKEFEVVLVRESTQSSIRLVVQAENPATAAMIAEMSLGRGWSTVSAKPIQQAA